VEGEDSMLGRGRGGDRGYILGDWATDARECRLCMVLWHGMQATSWIVSEKKDPCVHWLGWGRKAVREKWTRC